MDEEVIEGAVEETITGESAEVEDNSEQEEATANEEAEEGVKEEDDTGAEEQSEELSEGAKEPEKPVGRAQTRIQTLSAELKAEREEKERLVSERAVAQAQLENYRQSQHQSRSENERREEEDRLALLDPTERELYHTNNRMLQLEHKLNQLDVQRANDRDRASFEAKAATNEIYGKHATEVEAMYQEGLERGVQASREDLHSFLLGRELKKDMAKRVSKKRASASKRIDSVTSKSANARGDVSGSKKGKTAADRLSGVLI